MKPDDHKTRSLTPLLDLARRFGFKLKKPRYDTAVLYGPCKCGSGNKFKFCCYRKPKEKA